MQNEERPDQPFRLLHFALCIFHFAFAAALIAATDEPPARPIRLDLRIEPAGWKCELADVEAVLRSAGDQLTVHYGGHELPAIRVEPRGGPIVLFDRAPDGAVRMRLNTGDKLWAQMAYQFAHELCHVMCVYREDRTGCKWFEEAMCEMASLYALRRMAAAWREHPPYPNWREYADALDGYAQERLDAAKLPEGVTLAAWYADHAEKLRAKADDRPLNTVVAAALLPMIEREPERWESLRWLNADEKTGAKTMGEYLADWRRHTPDRHRAFIERIAAELGVKLDDGDDAGGAP